MYEHSENEFFKSFFVFHVRFHIYFCGFFPLCQLTPGGKAMVGGVQKGYYILSVNGTDLDGLTHHEVQHLIRTAGSALRLEITK